jgi:hypothetical protein
MTQDLVSHAGLVPVMALAQRARLGDLVAGHVRRPRPTVVAVTVGGGGLFLVIRGPG